MKTADLLEKPSVEEQMSCLSPVFLFIKGLKLEARQLTGRDPKGDGLEQTGMVYVYVKAIGVTEDVTHPSPYHPLTILQIDGSEVRLQGKAL